MEMPVIRDLKNRVPFRPFVLTLVDGRVYEIPHQDYIQVATTGRHVVVFNRDNSLAVYIELLLIVSVEVDEPPPNADNGGG